TNQRAVAYCGVDLLCVVLRVPAIAEQREGNARGSDGLFGRFVLRGESKWRCVSAKAAGIRQKLDTRCFRRLDDRDVLGHPPPDLASGDEEQLLDPGERGPQG